MELLALSLLVLGYFLVLMSDPENWSYEFRILVRRLGWKP